ncbi:DNA-binding transcriptional regulator, IclR family [Parafrankia irregularis]|uniref:DNA-binding transcriptional regulator, IclR family n=1 Tax=Parafrankia irregularis TaxID=795642 RepID=A0A0S4QMK3_9ACTN|nr:MULTISPECIES: helix-turn-helix domain-containing protein [Parafrankia]MBE3201281.1 helix-turn-helix domain-containing protein [Parafrankia sp. CH37]CUU56271.1 DNA-binding transcriptional regulator, IclR family [Parafrankia irregularis]
MTAITGEDTVTADRAPAGSHPASPAPPAAGCDDGDQEPAGKSGQGVLERAFQLLEAVSGEGTAGLSRLARLADLPKATTYRLLDQLVAVGAVERVHSAYRVGPAVHRMRNVRPSHTPLLRASHTPVRDLVRDSDATVIIAVLRDDPDVVVVDAVSVLAPAHGVVLSPTSSAPPATASGQVLLAERPDLDGPPQFSEAEWRRARADIRDRGVAMDSQMLVRGICCVAAAIRRPNGQAVASVAVITAAGRVSIRHIDQVRRAAASISRNLAMRG